MKEHVLKPYELIAQMYDQIMEDIDYDYWADYLDGIIQEYAPNARTLLELGGGTGNLSISLNELDCYEISCSDLSAKMIQIAKLKPTKGRAITFLELDARSFVSKSTFDVIFFVFDSLNYLTSLEDVKACFRQVHKAINPNGLWLFDFVTNKHCLENAKDFAFEESFYNGYRVVREATYPIDNALHQTKFRIYEGANTLHCIAEEYHIQKPYHLEEIKHALLECGFGIEGTFSDFSDQFNGKESKRFTIAARCLKNM